MGFWSEAGKCAIFILGCVCTSALTVIIIIKWKEYLCICYLQDLGNSAPDGLAYIVLSSGSITRGVLSNIKLSAPTYITSSWMYVYILCVILYRIAGIFRGGKYSFFSNKSSFRAFYFRFCFTSAILHYSRPHPFCEISFFGLILEQKKRKLNPTKITRYTVLLYSCASCNLPLQTQGRRNILA